MEILEYNSKLTVDDSFDFCARIISSWHLLSLYGALQKFAAQENRAIKGVVFISSFNADGIKKFRIDETMLRQLENVYITYYFMDGKHLSKKEYLVHLFKLMSTNAWQGKPLYLFSSFDYNFIWTHDFDICTKRKLILCRTDEGSGTYIPKKDFYFFGYPETESLLKKKFKAFIRTTLRTISIINVKSAGITLSSFFLLDKKNGFFMTNEENASFMRKIIVTSISDVLDNLKKEQVLILKDYDWNMLSESDSIDFYQKIIHCINSYTNKEIYIKRHPCDTDEKFSTTIKSSNRNVYIIDSVNGIENLYMQLSPCLVFGGDSTATYTLRILFSTKIINFTQLYLLYKVKNEVRLKNIIKRNRYFKNVKDNILIDSLEDKRLLEIVNDL